MRRGIEVGLLVCGVCVASLMNQGTAAAQDASAAVKKEGLIGEVVVTARRRAERLQDVPVAVTALDNQFLTQTQIKSATDLQYVAPSLEVNTNSVREGGRYSLRGQGTTIGASEGVVVYLADTPVPQFVSGGVGMYYDLDNIQVLNGPQGTLFGRNTTGGAVLFDPKKPVDGTSGFLELGYGNYNDREATGAINFALAPGKLMVRIAATGRLRDGFTHNLFDGKNYDDLNYWGVRLGIIARPVDSIENYVLVQETKSQPNGSTWVLTNVNPAGPAIFVYPQLAALFAAQQARGPRVVDTTNAPIYRASTTAVIDTATFTLTPQITAKNIFSFYDTKTVAGYDLDGTPVDVISFPNVPNMGNITAGPLSAADYYTEEFQLSGKSLHGDLTWTAGFFYETYGTSQPLNVGLSVFGNLSDSFPTEHANSKAPYAQATLNLGAFSSALNKFNLTAGYRYTWDEATTTLNNWNDRTKACTSTSTGFAPNCQVTLSGKFSGATYNLSLDYHVTPSTLLYVTNRKGYKSGGFNSGFSATSPFRKFGPEHVVDYEAGVKSDFRLGMPIRVDLAAFDDEYSDIQRAQTILVNNPPSPPRVAGGILNAARARITGVELQTTVRPTSALTLTGYYSYLDARYLKYSYLGVNLAGYRLPFTPEDKVGLTVRYQLPVPESIGAISISAAYSYTSLFRWNDIELPGNTIGDYGLTNFTADWAPRVAGKPITVTFFVTNAFDLTYRQISGVQYNSVGISAAVYGEPRMFGVRLKYEFD